MGSNSMEYGISKLTLGPIGSILNFILYGPRYGPTA